MECYFAYLSRKAIPLPDLSRKLKFGRLIEGRPKSKVKIRNQEMLQPGGPKWVTKFSFAYLSKKKKG
jgi:hypothetical protein